MKTDIELLDRYMNKNTYRVDDIFMRLMGLGKFESPYKDIDLVDLDILKSEIDISVQCLFVFKRFRQINKLFDGKVQIDYTEKCFTIDDHKFYSLDDLEKAWNNRIFL